MKNKRILILTASLLLFVLQAGSQNWDIIRADFVYNYSYTGYNDDVSESVWVDSIQIEPGDTLFYLNRKVNILDNYMLTNCPNFLQKEVHKTDSSVSFNDTSTFLIKRNLIPGNSWLFDTLHNITASCISKTYGSTFGLDDSIAVVVLTGNDTLLVSKLFGILSFPDQYSDHTHTLVGIDNIGLGICLPKFIDFFSFNVGDRFVYSMNYGDPGGYYESLYRLTILNIISQTDTMKYRARREYWTRMEEWKTDESSGSDTVYFEFRKNDYPVSDLYNNQLLSNFCLTSEFYPECNPYYGFSKIWMDADNLVTKSIGCETEACFNHSVFCGDILQSDTLSASEDSYYQIIKESIGLYYESINYFESNYSKQLLAWETSNGSYGNIDTLENWLHYLDRKQMEENNLSIYPNPSSGTLTITNPKGEYQQFSIRDLTGKLVLTGTLNKENCIMNLTGFKNGIYILEAAGKYKTSRKKLIIKN